LIISFIAGITSLDTIAEKAGIFLGSELGLQCYICAFWYKTVLFRTLGSLTWSTSLYNPHEQIVDKI